MSNLQIQGRQNIYHVDKGACDAYISAAFACNDVTVVPSRRAWIPVRVVQNRIKIGAETTEILIFFSPTIK